jgi:hypothetical protein
VDQKAITKGHLKPYLKAVRERIAKNWAATIKVRTVLPHSTLFPRVFSDLCVKCRDAAHHAVFHSGMGSPRRRAQTPSRLAVALTAKLDPPLPVHTLTGASTTPCSSFAG